MWPGREKTTVEEGSERCDMRKAQPAIVGFENKRKEPRDVKSLSYQNQENKPRNLCFHVSGCGSCTSEV